MLAYLAIRHPDRPVSRTAVATALWPDAPLEQGLSNLRSALWRLPRPTARRLVEAVRGTDLRLAPDLVVDYRRVVGPGRHDGFPAGGGDVEHQLAALTRDLLPGWDEEWLDLERESFRQVRMHRLEQLASHLRSEARFADALCAALAAVACDPLRESAHRIVLDVHLAEGNPSEAVRHFDTYRTLLHRELGLHPSTEMSAKVEALDARRRRPPRSAGTGRAPRTRSGRPRG
jgi:DNA-binding SARP family transcriptional activator